MKKHLLNYFKKYFLLFSLFLLSGFSYSQLTLAEWNFPNNPDDAVIDIAIPANAGKTIYTTGGTSALSFNVAGVTTRAAWCTNWNVAAGKAWEIQFSTTGYFNLEFSSKQQGSNTGPRDFAIEYKIGAGAWVPLGIAVLLNTGGWNGPTSFALPAACENQAVVYIHWITTTTTSIAGGVTAAGGASRIDNINISANDANNHYRSIATGNWNQLTTWESSPDLMAWSPAVFAPSKFSKTITVRSPHIVTITANASMDELTVQSGGTLDYAIGTQTINDGAGVDMQVDGNFVDRSNSATVWTGATPRWALGVNGTYVKSAATNATNWQNNYNGGINTIPATANWGVIKIAAGIDPTLTTINMFYPNLTIANVAGGNWVTAVGSTFTGNAGTATIKGSLDIGGPVPLGTVDFLCDNTNASCVQVLGNMWIRSGNAVRNYGTGFELYGNLIVDGSAGYDANDARKFKFSGGAVQNISGTGTLATFGVYQIQVTKAANDINLLRPVKVDNNLDLQNGIINSTMANIMVIEDNATVTNTSNASFVRGPVRKLGDEAFVFPVGKNNDYQAIGMSLGPAGGTTFFWTETFSNGCSSGCDGGSYSGPNGAWVQTATGGNGIGANKWFASGAECGNAAGICGSACGAADPSLHIGANPLSECTCLICGDPAGDCGAAYDADADGSCIGICTISGNVSTNKRMESPVINCSLYATPITISFNYIEGGQTTLDNATLWYYDGAAWAQIADMAKTAVCGGGQGRWTAFSAVLPVSASGNANVKIGFNWTNNADGTGSDPSFAIDDITLSVTTIVDQYTAEYFYTNPQVPYGNILLPNLATISNCEYWILTQDAGTSSRFITLYFDANSCGYQTTPANLLVANSNTGSWYDRGNSAFTAFNVTTLAAQTVYGPFTLGSLVPLPIELVKFDANYNGKTVDLNWVATSETNNNYFTIERTKDGHDFLTITKIRGAGTSSSTHYYSATDDAPQNGLSYYRLMQTDFNGSSSYSKLVAVRINENDFGIDYLYANQNQNEIYFGIKNISGNITAQVIDVLGRIVISQKLFSQEENEIVKINSSLLKNGLYTLRISNNQMVINKKFFY